MMRRFFALLLVFAGFAAAARPAAAQSTIALLPSGVTLRIHGQGATISGVLYQQGLDSVWLRSRAGDQTIRGIAIPAITSVERAQPAYAKSVLLGAGLGILVGAALYPSTSHNDHDVVIGSTMFAGTLLGLLFPRTDWIPVPLH